MMHYLFSTQQCYLPTRNSAASSIEATRGVMYQQAQQDAANQEPYDIFGTLKNKGKGKSLPVWLTDLKGKFITAKVQQNE